ncbi:hypothetical protein MRX96_044656 [Rhipicephalus microplus]
MSLSRNRSIRELAIHAHMSGRDVKSLADVVGASKNIKKLTYGDFGITSLQAFVSRLSAKIVQNNTILSVVLQGRMNQDWLGSSIKAFAI